VNFSVPIDPAVQELQEQSCKDNDDLLIIWMQSLDTLLQIGLPSSGLSLTSENSKLLSESPSQLDGKKAFVPIDPLHTLMEAFPDKDPAQVVMAFQVVAITVKFCCMLQ
jgi:hypothetical protein